MNLNYYKISNSLKGFFTHVFLAAVALTCVFPLFWMVRSALMTKETIFVDKSLIPQVIDFSNFTTAWVEGNFGTYFLNSLIYTGAVVFGLVIIASLAAYAFSRLQFPGKNFFFYMFVLSMMIPLPGSFVPLVVLMNKLHLVNTRIGYILCMINIGLAVSILLLKTFFDKMPSDLEDAARIDGCGHLGVWWHVALPLARPAIAVVVIFNALMVWNEFILANLLLSDDSLMTLQTGLYKFQGPNLADYPVLMAGLTIAVVPIILIYFYAESFYESFLNKGGGHRIMKRFMVATLMAGSITLAGLSFPAYAQEQEITATPDAVETNSETEAVQPLEDAVEMPEPETDPDILPSEEYVRLSWEASSQRDLMRLESLVEECIRIYGKAAEEQQSGLTDFPPRPETKNYQALNDVGTCAFIKAEAVMNSGETKEAIRQFQKIIEEYPYAQAWDPRGWFWSIAEKSQDSIDVLTGKAEEKFIQTTEPVKLIKPVLSQPGTAKIVDYTKYGKFEKVGTEKYFYRMKDPEGLSRAVGEGIYPNVGSVYDDPRYKIVKGEGRLEGDHWDFVQTPDLEAAFFKWVTAKEPWGVRLFYLGTIFEKSGMYLEAIRAYHALIVHFPKTVAWTYWQTPWYPGQAAIAKIRHIVRTHPELNLEDKWMKIEVKNGYDNDISNDQFVIYPGKIVQKSFLNRIKEMLGIKDKVRLGKVVKRVGEGKVRLVQYENGHWQMLVHDKPYVIHGLTYAPTKVGQSPDKGTLANWMEEDTNNNGRMDGPYDSWVDANFNDQQDPNEPVVGDFQLLKEMGVNTLRIYPHPDTINKELMRAMFKDYGIRVIIGNFLGKYAIGSGASWSEGTDYENPEHRKNMMESVKKMVMNHKDEPYTLMWLLGNENNYGIASNADKKPKAYFQFVNEVAKWIKSVDKDHPIAVGNGDTLFLDVFAENAPDVDIFSANVYRGDYGFGSFWEQVSDAAGKPAFITEYGCPAYARYLTYEEAEHAQADYHRGNWGDIEENLAGNPRGTGNALGGVVFEWMDEWWKNYEPFFHDRKSDAIGPFPGGYYFEEWFGLAGQGNGLHSPFLRQLRESYFVYKNFWTK